VKNLMKLKASRTPRPLRLALSAVAVIAAAGIVTGQGNAGPAFKADKVPHSRTVTNVTYPSLRHSLLTVKGSQASDKLALRLKDGEPGVLQVDVGDDGSADFDFQRDEIARIAVDARAGDDLVRIDESNGAFTDSIPTALVGGAGNDNLAGGSGREVLFGGAGNDSIDGNGGNDVAVMGAGDDTFVWDPGDGSDTIEGEAGADTMLFNGANVAEQAALSANGNRLSFFRNPGTITMDTHGVEMVDFKALDGADVVTVNDLTGTGVSGVNIDLAGGGDGQADTVIVNGSNRNDTISVNGDASAVAVFGRSTLVAIQHQEPEDELAVNGLGRNDAISAAELAAEAIALILDGGAGNDTLAGAKGIETLRGGDGNDSIDGNGGNDLALLGAGDDTFVWDPGDGSDTIEGEAGADTMLFNGANVAEQVDLSANGNRLRFFRDPGTITMDTDGVERVDFNALGGADEVTVNNLAGTDVSSVNIDLAGTPGGGDGQADTVVVNGTNGNDTVDVSGDADAVTVSGLAATIGVLHPEAANDRLQINTLAGTDTVDPDGLAAGVIQLFVDGVLVA
jgi:Ca2+-binding RTX toxin-like protein